MTLTIPRAPAVVAETVRVPCRPALDTEMPPAVLRMRLRALRAGWDVMVTYAAGAEVRGTYVAEDDPTTGRAKRLVRTPVELESIALRAATAHARRFLVWERTPGAKWTPASGYGYSRTESIHKLNFSKLEW